MGNMEVTKTTVCENPHTVTRGCNSQSSDFDLSERENEVFKGDRGKLGIHWLRGTVLDTKMKWAVDRFIMLFGPEYEEKHYGVLPMYDRHYCWPSGAKIMFHSTEAGSDLTDGRIALEIPGLALEALPMLHIAQLCKALDRRGFQATRLDVFYDDTRRLVTPSVLLRTVYEAGLFPDDPVKEDWQHFRVMTPKIRVKKGVGVTHDEVTFGLRGSSGSGKYLRIYDKQLESNDWNNAIRYELELSRHKARLAFQKIVEAWSGGQDTSGLVSVLGEMIGGCIDFRERTDRAGDKNLGRLKRYHFWQTIIDSIGRAALIGKRVVRTIEKAATWVSTQVVGTLQMITKAKGPEEFVAQIVEACLRKDRLRPHHQKIIAAYQQAAGGPGGGAAGE